MRGRAGGLRRRIGSGDALADADSSWIVRFALVVGCSLVGSVVSAIVHAVDGSVSVVRSAVVDAGGVARVPGGKLLRLRDHGRRHG